MKVIPLSVCLVLVGVFVGIACTLLFTKESVPAFEWSQPFFIAMMTLLLLLGFILGSMIIYTTRA